MLVISVMAAMFACRCQSINRSSLSSSPLCTLLVSGNLFHARGPSYSKTCGHTYNSVVVTNISTIFNVTITVVHPPHPPPLHLHHTLLACSPPLPHPCARVCFVR